MPKQNFIKTQDIETRDMLLSENFQLIDESNGIFTFINKPNVKFEKKENLKFTYSNMLSV